MIILITTILLDTKCNISINTQQIHLNLQTNNLHQCTTCILCAMLCARTISSTQMFIPLFCFYISIFTMHDSYSFHNHALFIRASVRWQFFLSQLHNLIVVVSKALLAWAEICGPPDGGQWSYTDIHIQFMVRFHDRSKENRPQPYRKNEQSERWMGPREKTVQGKMHWPVYHKVQRFHFCWMICLKITTPYSHM